MPVKVKFPSFGSSVVRVGNVWYPENQKKIADENQKLIQLAFISEKQKMARIYRPTGKPACMPIKFPN